MRRPSFTLLLLLCLAFCFLGTVSCRNHAPHPAPPRPLTKSAWPSPNTPIVIPTPKRMTLAGSRLRLNRTTRLVVADSATAQDKMAALAVQQAVLAEMGPPLLRIVRAKRVRQADNVLVFGEPSRMPLMTRLLRRSGANTPTHPEGYCLRVGTHGAVVAGHDPAGTFYGAQTLCQLIGDDDKGLFVWPVQIDDYPSLSWRGAHLFVGNHALPFHKRLIVGVFARLKMNNLVLQCEQARWDTLGKTAPPWAMSKSDLRQDIAFARRHFLTVTPLVNSVGHMPWLLDNAQHRVWAEDPQTPYAASVTNAQLNKFLFRLEDEVLDTFGSDALHIGGDEVTMRGRYPYVSQSRYPTVAEAYVAQVTKLHDHLKKRGVQTMLWGDMLLAPGEAPGETAGFTNAVSDAQAQWTRARLPKDIIIADWHYAASAAFSSPKLLQSAGFGPIIGATWEDPANIGAFSRVLAQGGQRGLLQTTWAGYESRAENLNHESAQFVAFVIAAEEAWNGGSVPPDRLPYDPAQVFWTLYGKKTPAPPTSTP